MQNNEGKNRFLATVIGLLPLFLFSNSLANSLAFGATFLFVNTVTALVALFFPTELEKKYIFAITLFSAAFAVSISASIIRIIDPFLYESIYSKLFIISFLPPIFKLSSSEILKRERERTNEEMMLGFIYSSVLILFGTLREFIASGTVVLSMSTISHTFLPIIASPVGAFILLGVIIAGIRFFSKIIKEGNE